MGREEYMDIDKLLEEIGEEERKKNIKQEVDEMSWKKIEAAMDAEDGKKEKLSFKFYKFNKKYHITKVAIAFVMIAIIAAIPFAYEYGKQAANNNIAMTKSTDSIKDDTKTNANSAISDNTSDTKKEDNNNAVNSLGDRRPEAPALDANYVKAYGTVEKIAKGKFDKFSIYSNVELNYNSENKKNYYRFELYEERKDYKLPRMYYYNVYTSDFSVESTPYREGESYDLTDNEIAILINKADNLGLSDYSEINNNIAVSGNFTNTFADGGKNIPIDSYMYKGNKNFYYTYDKKTGELYKFDVKTSSKKSIYKLNIEQFSTATISLKKDMDGDGKEEDVKFDPVRGILSVNGVSITIDSNVELNAFDVVDLYKNNNRKAMYLKYDLENDYKDNSYYIYKDGLISKVLSCGGTPEIQEDGKVLFKNIISQFFSTHFKDEEYQYYKDDTFGKLNKDIYLQKDMNSGNVPTLTAKHSLKIYNTKGGSMVAATIKPGEIVKLLGTDENDYVEIQSASGIKGWFKFNKFTNKVEELNLDEAQVFDNIVRAG